ncbi:MAG: hypothetical protein GY719_05125 [bacterium]|nr:hypothetical protein [bacterium]
MKTQVAVCALVLASSIAIPAWPASVLHVNANTLTTPKKKDPTQIRVRGKARAEVMILDTADEGKQIQLEGILIEFASDPSCAGSGYSIDSCQASQAAQGEGQVMTCLAPPLPGPPHPGNCADAWITSSEATLAGSTFGTFAPCKHLGCP